MVDYNNKSSGSGTNSQQSMVVGRGGEKWQNIAEKRREIEKCLQKNRMNLWELREFALSEGGLLNSSIRKRAWKKLVCVKDHESSSSPRRSPEKVHVPDKELDLIQKDAGRSVIYRYDSENNKSPSCSNSRVQALKAQKRSLESVLSNTIGKPLAKGQQKSHYYQGLHDVAGAFLHQIGDVDETTSLLRRVCQSHLRDPLQKDFSKLSWFLNAVLPPLLEKVDPTLNSFFRELEVDVSSFVLPWLITWFTHDIIDPNVSARLIDAFMAAHATFPLYFIVAMITNAQNRDELMYVEPDACMVAVAVKKFPKSICSDFEPQPNKVTCQELIDEGLRLMQLYPPRDLVRMAARNFPQMTDYTEFITVTNSMAILRPPQSWALMSYTSGYGTQEDAVQAHTDIKPIFTRAWIASGVRQIMLGAPEIIPRRCVGVEKGKAAAPLLTTLMIIVPTTWAIFIQLFLTFVTSQYVFLKGLQDGQRIYAEAATQSMHSITNNNNKPMNRNGIDIRVTREYETTKMITAVS
eukprot:CAMPEP_0202476160 /NCGR_PEP_ID=MMETSP1360-20130828/93279_1 /ASSEMBLY_ACC=CAM_ASM_000848 /TAXON_ID=515479 /ORGANISM="Licmophora paradoxa, Strain CCMP2313" /LENGTH=520 /DNA_ID=CAMNT_0049103359 /DNA_START=58 /DNA_END=1620 /DNA_ORIENTATION=+